MSSNITISVFFLEQIIICNNQFSLEQILYTLVKSSPLKTTFSRFWVLASQFIKFVSILNWWVNSSSKFISFFIFMTQNSSVNLKLVHFLLWVRIPSKSQFLNFRTCSDENLLNSSCHFWKCGSVFFHILHQLSVSSHITPLYFFSSNIIHFLQKWAH